MKLSNNSKILQILASALMVFVVSCQSAQTQHAKDSLRKRQALAAENSALAARANSLRNQMRNAQYEGDYLSAAEIRKELNEVTNKMEQTRVTPPRVTQYNNNTEAGSYYYSGGMMLNARTNGSSGYVNGGQDTTSSRMLRSTK